MANLNEMYMKRCLELAQLGSAYAAPNPMVGSVIVHNGKIIGEGFHQRCGEAHAEVNAITSVKNHNLLKESTLYVNLEPCAHYGKTPPCSLLIIEKKIPKVVIGCVDTFSEVAGKGIEMLQNAGVEVIVDVLKTESRLLNKRFFTFHEKKRPYIFLKWAETIDGFMDKERKAEEPAAWITDDICRMVVHKMRSEEAAILVGTNTALWDNPALNLREWPGENPLRLVIDRNLRLPQHLKLFDGTQQTLVFTEKHHTAFLNVQYVNIDFSQNILPQIMQELYKKNITSLIVEGGAILLQSFINQQLWDEAFKFIGPHLFKKGIKGPVFSNNPTYHQTIGNSQLFVFHNRIE